MAMDLEIPDPLKAEDEELHAELIAAIDLGGAVGDPLRRSPSCSSRTS
jgi:hypothetical protein